MTLVAPAGTSRALLAAVRAAEHTLDDRRILGRQLDLGHGPAGSASRSSPLVPPNQLSRLVIMIGNAVCNGRSLLSRSTVSTTTFPCPAPVRPVEHGVERIARGTLGQDMRRPFERQLAGLGHNHIVEPDMQHQGRVFVLLGDDRVVKRFARGPRADPSDRAR